MTKRLLVVGLAIFGFGSVAAIQAQKEEGALATQILVGVDARSTPPANASDLTITVDGRKVPLSSWTPIVPAEAQVALLIDDGLRESVGRNLDSLRAFLKGLPPGIEVLVGYMQNGRVVQAQPFTTDHDAAAAAIRLPEGVPGESASPYFCLSDFVKKWPGALPADADTAIRREEQAAPKQKARFVLMITNGVDPYNGSTSVMNQDSPYVATAVTDAQRAGVVVYSIYFTDAGIRGPSASLSGQSYLQQLSDGTGGVNYYEGVGNPISMDPFLKQFVQALAKSYIATFDAPAGKGSHDLASVKIASASKAKLRAARAVRAGNLE